MLSSSPASTPSPEKTKLPKETKAEKSKSTKTTEKIKSQAKAAINSTHGQNKSSVQSSEKPTLKIKQADFDLSIAITFLSHIKKYGEKFDLESNAKARIRIGEIKDTDEPSFYVSTKDNRKIKKTDRTEEGRKAENKNTTTKRAITMLKAIADCLVAQNRLSSTKVDTVFSTIEKQGYISVKDASNLLDLLETGRRAVYVSPIIVQSDSKGTPGVPSILKINNNPFD